MGRRAVIPIQCSDYKEERIMTIKNLMVNPVSLMRWTVAVIAAALLGTIMALIYTGVFIWNLSVLTDPILDNPYATGSPFTLAQVMAIFGAFGLAAGFSDRVEKKLKRDMRLVAIYHFVSALCFCMLGLLLPAIPYAQEGTAAYWIIVVAILVAICGAALSFSWGTVSWLYHIPRILKNEDPIGPTICPSARCN